jgi:Aldehyde dehydrogenase family/Glutathione S-transferase, N-terminal domain
MREEPFGPLALINPVASLDEAIEKANALPYGLAAYAFTRSALNADRLAEGVESSNLSINNLVASIAETPFGGVKESGYGREGGTGACLRNRPNRSVSRRLKTTRSMLEKTKRPGDLRLSTFSWCWSTRTASYLKINPLGRVPVLLLDSGEPLAENTAILPYLGKRFDLWPIDTIAEAKALSLIGFFAASVHPAHAHISRPERYASDTAAFPTLKETGQLFTASDLSQNYGGWSIRYKGR